MRLLPSPRNVQSCYWSVPTLFLRHPTWLAASDSPWTCVRQQQEAPLSSTDDCLNCRHWQPRDPSEQDDDRRA